VNIVNNVNIAGAFPHLGSYAA